uniref:Uncharacterized protein n=1 Tax=Amphimedon queenslandica TaxID=400682 RepID=A0A1X7TG64_AMPQE
MKSRADAVKILSSSKTNPQQKRQFFPPGRPTAPPRGGGQSQRGSWPKRGHYKQPAKNFIKNTKQLILNRGGITTSSGGAKHRGKTSSLPCKLAGHQPRSVDLRHHFGLQDRFPIKPNPIVTPQSRCGLLRGTIPHQRRGRQNAFQGSNNRVAPSGSRERVLFQPIPCSQEGWWHEASNKSKKPQRARSPPAFQDGGLPYLKGHHKERGLDDKDRPKGRFLHDSNPPVPPSSPTLRCSRLPLPVHMSAIQPVLCSLGLYQDPEASSNPTQRARSEASGIHRQYPCLGRVGRASEGPYGGTGIPTRKSGLYNPPREVSDGLDPGDKIPGDDGGLPLPGASSAWSKNKEGQARGCKDGKPARPSHSSRGVTPTGETQFSVPGSSSRPSLLQRNPEGPNSSSGAELPMLQCPLPPVPTSQGGPKLVGEPIVSLEQEEPSSKATRFPHRIGCIPHRLGSILPGNPDWRSLVSEGETTPHQLPGVASSYPGSEDRQDNQASTAVAGQPNSSSLHQQPWRDSLGPGSSPSSRPLDVVPGETYSLNSTASSWEGECSSRHRVESDERSLRLVPKPVDFSTGNGSFPLPGGGLVCNSSDLQTPPPPLLQLETRSPSRSNGCLSPGLETGERICQPTLESHREGTGKNRGAADRSNPDSSNMAISAM